MNAPVILGLGSVSAALLGLLVLGWGARRERGRVFWLLIAAIFLVGAGFGAAETVYRLAVEQDRDRRPKGTPISSTIVEPPAPSSPTPASVASPSPSKTSAPTATPSVTPTPRPTAEPRPAPTLPPATLPAAPFFATPGDIGALASSLIPEERGIVATLDDPPFYILNVEVDLDGLTIDGNAGIIFTNNERDALDAIYLRLYPNADHYEEGETRIDAVNVDGSGADFSFEDVSHTILKVPLPGPLPPGDPVVLQIDFSVTVPRRSDRFGYDRGVMSLGHWYPMLAVYDDEGWNLDPYVALGDAFYSDVAFFIVHLTVPDGTIVAATGVETGRILHGPPRATTVYVSAATRDFALALSRDYQVLSTEVADTTVTAYFLPGHEQGGRRALRVAAEALEVYNARFGRYPYAELDVAETAFSVFGAPGGMEFPGLVFIGSEFYEPGGLFSSELDVVVAHEVAHQWWYGVVGNNQVDEPWLDEAFATYSSIIYAEQAQDALAAEMLFWSQAALPYQLLQILGADGPLQSSLLDYGDDLITYQALVYGKGALFLAQLRELLGDDAFFALLEFHYQTYQYGLLAPGDFRRSIEGSLEASGVSPTELAEALALYDAVVLRGEPIEGLPGLGELGGMLDGDLLPQEVDELMELLDKLWEGLEP